MKQKNPKNVDQLSTTIAKHFVHIFLKFIEAVVVSTIIPPLTIHSSSKNHKGDNSLHYDLFLDLPM